MTSKTRYSHRVRCRNCRSRQRIKRHPDDYKIARRCLGCGSTKLYSIEEERRRELKKQETCYCMAIPFPHRKGSLRFCEHHPLADVVATEEEWEQYQGIIETPRSG